MKSNDMLAIFKHSANKEGMVGIGSVLRSTLTSIYLQTPQDQESLNISQDVYVWIAQNIFYDIGYYAVQFIGHDNENVGILILDNLVDEFSM